MRLSIEDIAAILGQDEASFTAAERSVTCSSVSYDSRTVERGALFVCIRGETSDGHDYAPMAMEKGACALLCERPLPDVPLPQFVVQDSVKALGTIAHAWRKRSRAKVIGITGTCGKTTVKEMIAHVLSAFGRTAKSVRNHNNQLGMASGMLATDGNEDFWVFELGISHPQDMDELGAILEPDIAVILNVGQGHTEGLGDMGVAWYKTRLLLHLAKNGQAVVCADYQDLVWKAFGTHVSPLYFYSGRKGDVSGKSGTSDAFAYWLSDTPSGGLYRVCIDGETRDLTAPLFGAYGAENVMATVFVAKLVGLNLDAIAKVLPTVELPKQRFSKLTIGSFHIIDDTYNANPLSMQRMLEAARQSAGDEAFIPVLGEMRELGKESQAAHEALGKSLVDFAPKAVFWKGGEGEQVLRGFTEAGGKAPFYTTTSVAGFLSQLQQETRGENGGNMPVTLLFKGSRANRLEEYLEGVTKALEGEGHVL